MIRIWYRNWKNNYYCSQITKQFKKKITITKHCETKFDMMTNKAENLIFHSNLLKRNHVRIHEKYNRLAILYFLLDDWRVGPISRYNLVSGHFPEFGSPNGKILNGFFPNTVFSNYFYRITRTPNVFFPNCVFYGIIYMKFPVFV